MRALCLLICCLLLSLPARAERVDLYRRAGANGGGGAALSTTTPAATGTTGAVGVGTTAARADHVHALSAHAPTHGNSGSDAVSLDASQVSTGTLSIGRIPTGTTSTTVPLGNDSRFLPAGTAAGQLAVYNGSGWQVLAAGTASQVLGGGYSGFGNLPSAQLANALTQTVILSAQGNVTGTSYFPAGTSSATVSSITNSFAGVVPVLKTGTLQALACYKSGSGAAPVGGLAFTALICTMALTAEAASCSTTALTCTASSSQWGCSDFTHTASVTQGNSIAYQLVSTNTVGGVSMVCAALIQ